MELLQKQYPALGTCKQFQWYVLHESAVREVLQTLFQVLKTGVTDGQCGAEPDAQKQQVRCADCVSTSSSSTTSFKMRR